MKKRISKVLALTIVFVMMMSTMAMAAPEERISNVLKADFTVSDGDSESGKVGSLDELINALNNSSIDTITFTNDIESEEPIIVNRPVTIDGDNHELSFSGLENISSTTDDGLIISNTNNVTVKNLTVDAGLENPATWTGTYAIHVEEEANVTLNGVTATGGNGGIIVNGSTVTLQGDIDVSDNGYGGIEVSYGKGLLGKALKLDVSGARIENDSEAPGKPTIWEDGVENCVEGANNYTVIDIKKNDGNDQTHYYLDADNAIIVELSWTLEEETIEASVGEEKSAIVTANLVDGYAPVDAILAIKVSKEGIDRGDFEFTRIEGTEITEDMPEQYAEWLNATVKSSENMLTFYWGPKEGTKIEETWTNTAHFKFNEAGEYTINIYLIEAPYDYE